MRLHGGGETLEHGVFDGCRWMEGFRVKKNPFLMSFECRVRANEGLVWREPGRQVEDDGVGDGEHYRLVFKIARD
jgi:hypothetical protein